MEKYEYVENIIKESSQSFYRAFSELKKDKANAVYAIYAFCRVADDAIDIDRDLDKLNMLKKKLKAAYEGDAPDDLLFQALADAFKKFPGPIDPYMDLLDGLRDDYYNKPIKTEEDLEAYCYKAAGTVGIMLLPVLAKTKLKEHSKKLTEVAVELGKAMQLTNILRDVRDDLMNDRVYFPDDVMATHGLEIEITRTGLVTPEWRSLTEHYIDIAKAKYESFYKHVDLFDEDTRYPTYLAAKFYEGILEEIQRSKYKNINKRLHVGKLRKFLIMKKAKMDLNKRGLL